MSMLGLRDCKWRLAELVVGRKTPEIWKEKRKEIEREPQ